jgi:hypothetical protein
VLVTLEVADDDVRSGLGDAVLQVLPPAIFSIMGREPSRAVRCM